jgi:hypothetical protein
VTLLFIGVCFLSSIPSNRHEHLHLLTPCSFPFPPPFDPPPPLPSFLSSCLTRSQLSQQNTVATNARLSLFLPAAFHFDWCSSPFPVLVSVALESDCSLAIHSACSLV